MCQSVHTGVFVQLFRGAPNKYVYKWLLGKKSWLYRTIRTDWSFYFASSSNGLASIMKILCILDGHSPWINALHPVQCLVICHIYTIPNVLLCIPMGVVSLYVCISFLRRQQSCSYRVGTHSTLIVPEN